MLYTPPHSYARKSVSSPLSLAKIKLTCGMTLIELMVGIGITSVLATIALPNMSDFIVELRVDNEIYRLSRLLTLARNHAISTNSRVVICPISASGDCTTNWHDELIVFVDNNGNQQFDNAANDLLIATKASVKQGDVLTYAMNRNKITYQATGHLFGLSNGTLRYCPKGYSAKSRAIVVARSGRFYATTDSNSDGIDETRSNQVIQCD